jgi:hypothetical protein
MRHRFAEASDKKTHQARVNEHCEMVHVDAVAELAVRLCFVQRNRDALLSQTAIRNALHNARLIEAVMRAAERGERRRVILSESKRACW